MVFIYCLLPFLKKHCHIPVFIWVFKKGLTASGVLLAQQILLFEHCIENNYHLWLIFKVVHCAIWYHLYNLKNVKNTHGGVLLLVK